MDQATWRQHPVYEFYEVSSCGRVRSIDAYRPAKRRSGTEYVRFVKGKELKPALTPNGYQFVSVWKDGQRHQVTVHKLVCETFHGPKLEGMEVRHLNGDKTDNRAENLAWGTRSENNLDRQRHGTDYQLNKTHCPRGHEYTPENTYIQTGPNRRPGRACRTCVREKRAAKKFLDKLPRPQEVA